MMMNQDLINQLDKVWIALEDAINQEYDNARNVYTSRLKMMQLNVESFQVELAEAQEEAELDW